MTFKAKIPVYWAPQKGQQTLFATCPADEVFYGGTRGGGKSDGAIGKQIRGATRYAHAWNGLIVRRKFKDLNEIRRRFDELIRNGMPAARVGGEKETNYVRFSNGAVVTLTAIQHMDQTADWIGHQFCVAQGTPVLMADMSTRPIEDIQPGDLIHTLEGPKRVRAVTGGKPAQCVALKSPWGVQIHPVDHPILTVFGWQSYASILGIDSKEFEAILQDGGKLPDVRTLARFWLPASSLRTEREKFVRTPTVCRETCRSSRDSQSKYRPIPRHEWWLRQALWLTGEFAQQDQDYETEFYFSNDGSSDVLSGSGRATDSPGGYPHESRSRDVRLLSRLKTGQYVLPLLACVAGQVLWNGDTLDVLGSILEYNRLDILPSGPLGDELYIHPYTGDLRVATENTGFVACEISFLGERVVYDLTVEDVNHYITQFDSRQERSGITPGPVSANTQITVDEAPNIPFISNLIDFLRGSLRSPHGVPTQIVLTGNPGGPGSSSINLMYIQPSPEYLPGQIIRNTYKDDLGVEHVISQVFIKSTIYDNPILMKGDPKYVAMLMSIKDPMLKAAWLDGRWDVFIGQAFNFTDRHVLSEGIWPIPDYAPIYMTFDYGYGAPFSVGWWWVDNDNRIYRFAEWYGWDGKTPNKGCRMTDEDIADGILEREKQMGISGRKITRIGGRDCFQRKPNYMGGGQGPGTAENFESYAKSGRARERYGEACNLVLQPGDPSRELKIRQFRNRLRVPSDPHELPMLVIYPNCTHFKRTIPALCLSEMTGEDLDDGQEDHCLHPDTLILTNTGIRSIISLVGTTGQILNRFGEWEDYVRCWKTRENAQTIRLNTECGVIVCTPDHQFLTVNGWKEAQNLESSDLLVRNTVESATGCVADISREKESGCTYVSTEITGEKFHQAGTYITSTKTVVTTLRKTWKLFLSRFTPLVTPKSLITTTGLELYMPEPRNGTEVPKGSNGTNDNGHYTVKVLSKEVNPRADVYCLHVPSSNSFTLANGIISHNCYDEAAHLCMARPIGITDDAVSLIAAREAATREIEGLDSASKMAAADFAAFKRQLANRLPDGVTSEMLRNDPALDPSVFGLDEEAFDILREVGIKI